MEKAIVIKDLTVNHKGHVQPQMIVNQLQKLLKKHHFEIEGLSNSFAEKQMSVSFDGYHEMKDNQKQHIHIDCNFVDITPVSRSIGTVAYPWYNGTAKISFTGRVIGNKWMHSAEKPVKFFFQEMIHRFVFAFLDNPKEDVKKIVTELYDETYALIKASDMHGG